MIVKLLNFNFELINSTWHFSFTIWSINHHHTFRNLLYDHLMMNWSIINIFHDRDDWIQTVQTGDVLLIGNLQYIEHFYAIFSSVPPFGLLLSSSSRWLPFLSFFGRCGSPLFYSSCGILISMRYNFPLLWVDCNRNVTYKHALPFLLYNTRFHRRCNSVQFFINVPFQLKLFWNRKLKSLLLLSFSLLLEMWTKLRELESSLIGLIYEWNPTCIKRFDSNDWRWRRFSVCHFSNSFSLFFWPASSTSSKADWWKWVAAGGFFKERKKERKRGRKREKKRERRRRRHTSLLVCTEQMWTRPCHWRSLSASLGKSSHLELIRRDFFLQRRTAPSQSWVSIRSHFVALQSPRRRRRLSNLFGPHRRAWFHDVLSFLLSSSSSFSSCFFFSFLFLSFPFLLFLFQVTAEIPFRLDSDSFDSTC